MCRHCGKRFILEESYNKHIVRQNDTCSHKRYHTRLSITKSQLSIINLVKYQYNHRTALPCYYELIPISVFPKEYIPQIFDHVCDTGYVKRKCIGVLEFNKLVLVEDVFGEYYRVAILTENNEIKYGWVKYVFYSTYRKIHVLLPALVTTDKKSSFTLTRSDNSVKIKLRKIDEMSIELSQGPKKAVKNTSSNGQKHNDDIFNWQNLKVFKLPVFYQVRTDLPPSTEIKVRYKPIDHVSKRQSSRNVFGWNTKVLADNVFGYLHPGDIVQCYAILGDWIHIRYKNELVAWVNVKGGVGNINAEYDYNPFNNFNYRHTISIKVKTDEDKLILMKQLHPSVCNRLYERVKISPYQPVKPSFTFGDHKYNHDLLAVDSDYIIPDNYYDFCNEDISLISFTNYEI